MSALQNSRVIKSVTIPMDPISVHVMITSNLPMIVSPVNVSINLVYEHEVGRGD